jgi:hypothetical protein
VYRIHRDCHHRHVASVRPCPFFQGLTGINFSCHRYVIGVRVQGDGKYINKIETLVSDQGDWLFNVTGTAYYNALENWDTIPVEHRDTREVIQAAGDAYFNRFGNVNITVPFGSSPRSLTNPN